MGVSRSFGNYMRIDVMFEQAIYALGERNYGDRSGIHFYSGIQKGTPMQISTEMIHRILSDVRMGNAKHLQQNLDALFQELRNREELTYHQVYGVIANLLQACDKALENIGESIYSVLKEDLSGLENRLISLIGREALEGLITDILQTLCTKGQRQSARDNAVMVENILSYLQVNYSGNITLETLSKQFNISQNYLSALVKKHTGQNFVEILTDIRMKKACELMKSGEFKILKIAEMTGYSNEKYFSRVFRKTYGVPPTEWLKDQE